MSKVVSTKYGDRRLVHLPPVSLTGTETPEVRTLAPRGRTSTIAPKEYAYAEENSGNLVEQPGMGQTIYNSLLQGHDRVVPGATDSPHYMQYTPHGLNPAGAQQQSQTQPQQQTTNPQPQQPSGANQNERHIFYGPNGEILPGPPPGSKIPGYSGHHTSSRKTENFSIDAELFYGRIKTIQLMDSSSGGFPKIPDHLNADLLRKYGHYERTSVRIVSLNGEFHVHAVPQVPGSEYMSHPQYVPVFIDENDEYFHPSLPRRYRTPAELDRSYPYYDRAYPDYGNRPHTDDPMSSLRWRKDNDRDSVVETKPVERQPPYRPPRTHNSNRF